MMKLKCLMVALLISTSAMAAENAERGRLQTEAVFGKFGYSNSMSVNGNACTDILLFERKKIIDSAPMLQKLGFLNNELSTTTIRLKKNTVAMTFSFQIAVVATKEAFEANPTVDECAFDVNLSAPDEYGNDVEIPMFHYEFSRTTINKINWDKFEFQNLMKVANGFIFDPKFQMLIELEMNQNQ